MNQSHTGILIFNLGTPSAPTSKAVRKYLAEFLGDPYVIKLPKILRWLLLQGIILPYRSRKSAELYQKIWTAEGSPLLINSQRLASALQNNLGNDYVVKLGMRYGEPSLITALEAFKKLNLKQLIILPLFPQYSSTTTASGFDLIKQLIKKYGDTYPPVKFIEHYYTEPDYINALATEIKKHELDSKHLLFSFHGLPQSYVATGDPYELQCKITVEKIVAELGIKATQWSLAFQSRFGKQKWLQPYCDITLRNLAKTNKKKVVVVCPGFPVDCLETLEEINMRNREDFLAAGGLHFTYIPALNDAPTHIAALKKIILAHAD